MVFLQNVWWFLVLIGVMILLHELGHFVVARLFDVKVETFSFGFGPRLFGFKHGETDFRFSALPILGGYVKMAGDQPGEEATDPRSLIAKPRWQRLLITLAGPAVNVILAVILLTGLFMEHYPKVPTPPDPAVGYLAPDGAAAKAGIHEGDRVVQVDNVTDPNWEDIAMKEMASAGRPMQVWVLRDGQRLHFTIIPTLDQKDGIGVAGWGQQTEVQVGSVAPGTEAQRVGLQRGDVLLSANGEPLRSVSRLYEIEKATEGKPIQLEYSRKGQIHRVMVTPVKSEVDGQQRWMIGLTVESRIEITKLPFLAAVKESWRWNMQSAKMIFQFLEGMLERRMSPKSLVGPVGIAAMSGEAAREGAASYFSLMAAVSLNLAIFNLLPIPILDGGVIMMLLVEMLMRRELDLKVKEAVVKVGFVFLMMVVVFVIYNDISKILPG
ncbi:MAG TPA: RIP metalloprotease RseP [Bryobacteraceae bacterium]|jgi:regulator of sigma E protease|nr:RIP metalloprotease RseP [Bryobacteraceae bacterium]